MAIDPINLGMRILPADLPQPGAAGSLATGGTPAAGGTGGFGDSLRQAVAAVDSVSLEAHDKVSGLVEGNAADVHDAMIAVEKADLSFQLMLQVRNKVVQAYQQIAGMQF